MRKLFPILVLFCLTTGLAQTKLKKADQLFKTFFFIDAAKAYEEYLENVPKPSIQTLKNAADSYYNVDDNRNALRWYQKLYDAQGNNMEDAYFLKYIQSMKGVMDYERADQLTKDYLLRKGDQKQINHFLSQKRINDSLSKTKTLYTIKNLDINSTKSDFGTAFYGEKIIFTSARDTVNINKLYSWNKQPFLDIYVADRNSVDGSLFSEQLFLPNVMTKYHEATATVSPDLKTIYYTTNIVLKKKLIVDDSKTNNFQIVKGQIVNGQLVNPEKVFFNSKTYSVGHPSLSEDGRWLFFASDMPGGYGETDLYVVKVAEDGTMGSPINLGPSINTIGNELFPYYRNGILYFSSDGHFGWGDLDIYQSKFSVNMSFSEPRNLGIPINSNKDDFAYIVDDTDSYGYFSSNRAQGKGSDDIYSFVKSKPVCNELISGKVTNIKSKLIIADATISVYDAFGDLMTTTTTNANGEYQILLPCGKKVKITATKANHSTEQKDIETGKTDGAETKDVNFELSNYDDLIIVDKKGQEKISVNPIFFNYDKSDVTPQAAVELDKVVFVLQKFPNVKIKIESHTDSRGKDSYNMKLSDDRAKSTQTYILSKGIDPSRIESAIGYGESRLVNRCSNNVKCSEDEHFKNRRSDFIIIEK